jgi:hypothetical protein
MMHHPYAALLVGWVLLAQALSALGEVTIRLDAGSVLLSLAPTVAVVVSWWLSSRKVKEVKHLVNSQQDHLNARNKLLEDRIAQLEAQLAAK